MSRTPTPTSDPESARLAIIATATKMLAGEMDLIEGCRTILRYRDQLTERLDALFVTLEGIESETDDFPVGTVRDAWDPSALNMKDMKKAEYLRGAKGPLLEACREIISKLSN
jgi:hypothetical protein